MIGPFIKSSFDTLLKLHEVTSLKILLQRLLTLQQKSLAVKNKLDSAMARLDRLCSEEDDDDKLCDENEHERWGKLFEWVVRMGSSSPSC